MTRSEIAPIVLLRSDPEKFLASLSDEELLVLPYLHDLWLRPEQRAPDHDFRSWGQIGGRRSGKTHGTAVKMNELVESGAVRRPALMGPNEKRVDQMQIRALIETSPPWFRPERYKGGLLWPNGVVAVAFTAEAPDGPRGENIDLAWCCELVAWDRNTRIEAWNNITTATSEGVAQIFWDTTPKSAHDLIMALEREHAADPRKHVIARMQTFDNPFLSPDFVRSIVARYGQGTRRYREEILGEVFDEAQGALWHKAWLDKHRVSVAPGDFELRLVSADPANSDDADADETGLIVGSRGRDGHVYIERDLSGRYRPEVWVDMAISQCVDHGAAGIVIERSIGNWTGALVRSRAITRKVSVHEAPHGKPFPRRIEGRIYLREYKATTTKVVRAEGPAAETEAGRVHIVGDLPELELELTTFEPGAAQSPNRFDACAQLITELRGLLEERPRGQASEAVISAAAAANDLRDRLRSMGRGRRIGL